MSYLFSVVIQCCFGLDSLDHITLKPMREEPEYIGNLVQRAKPKCYVIAVFHHLPPVDYVPVSSYMQANTKL